jgi:hypothetical protein
LSGRGSGFCFDVEDRSFWFAHRNKAIIAAVRRFPPGSGHCSMSAAVTDAFQPPFAAQG